MMRKLVDLSAVLLAVSGCVMVNPSDVQISASPVPVVVGEPRPAVPETAYAHGLRKVLRQQETVAKEFSKRDWHELSQEANDWAAYTRELQGYAHTSADPARFRRYCDQLLQQIRRIDDAAARRDGPGCEQAIRGCDPILNQLSRDFPTAIVPAAPAPRPSPPAPNYVP